MLLRQSLQRRLFDEALPAGWPADPDGYTAADIPLRDPHADTIRPAELNSDKEIGDLLKLVW